MKKDILSVWTGAWVAAVLGGCYFGGTDSYEVTRLMLSASDGRLQVSMRVLEDLETGYGYGPTAGDGIRGYDQVISLPVPQSGRRALSPQPDQARAMDGRLNLRAFDVRAGVIESRDIRYMPENPADLRISPIPSGDLVSVRASRLDARHALLGTVTLSGSPWSLLHAADSLSLRHMDAADGRMFPVGATDVRMTPRSGALAVRGSNHVAVAAIGETEKNQLRIHFEEFSTKGEARYLGTFASSDPRMLPAVQADARMAVASSMVALAFGTTDGRTALVRMGRERTEFGESWVPGGGVALDGTPVAVQSDGQGARVMTVLADGGVLQHTVYGDDVSTEAITNSDNMDCGEEAACTVGVMPGDNVSVVLEASSEAGARVHILGTSLDDATFALGGRYAKGAPEVMGGTTPVAATFDGQGNFHGAWVEAGEDGSVRVQVRTVSNAGQVSGYVLFLKGAP